MKDKLYDLMDWARIEGLVYSEEDHPHDILGAHLSEDGVLVQVFLPGAVRIDLVLQEDGRKYPMTKEDDIGFFAVLLEKMQSIPDYKLSVVFDGGSRKTVKDPYRYIPEIPAEVYRSFNDGNCLDIYKWMGAHPMTIDNIEGIYFAVWAPNAVRVSLVGDFTMWDGRRLPMRRLGDTGVFDLFVPDLKQGTVYKYEMKAKSGMTYLKSDPYAFTSEVRPNFASCVCDIEHFKWTDQDWLENRRKKNHLTGPLSICEINLNTFAVSDDGREFYTYRELAVMIANYVKNIGYTHIELTPVMEYPHDETIGYQTSGYYAPTSRFGKPDDFKYFINYMHNHGIGVILDWTPAHFAADIHGLCGFDGTCLYEHYDPRQGTNPKLGTLIYNYARPEVSNFLLSNALFWLKEYHADGLCLDRVSAMLYLDYDRASNEWIPNIYGGKENLDAIAFIRRLNEICHREFPDVLIAANEDSGWERVTASLTDGGLGFDLRRHTNWYHDMIGYLELDPVFRGYHHNEILKSLLLGTSENYVLALDHTNAGVGRKSFAGRMPGRREMKLSNVRAALSYCMMHPGKKMMTAGIEQDGKEDCAEEMNRFLCDLIRFYQNTPALYQKDSLYDGFEWINSISANENMLVFLRKGENESDMLLIVCNFSALSYERHKIGVPFRGSFKEIFNSDRKEYGGSGILNLRAKSSKEDECDDRPDSIRINVPAMSVLAFRCTKKKNAPVSESRIEKAVRKSLAAGIANQSE